MDPNVRYLHGARLAAADHGRPSLDVDWLRERKRLVRLVLGEVLQAALIGLLVLILIGQRTPEGNECSLHDTQTDYVSV